MCILHTEPAERHSRDELMQIDLRLHGTICELSGNLRLLQAWRRLSDQIRVLLQLRDLVADDSGWLPAGHQGIVDAIRRGDAATCDDVLRTHTRRPAEQVLSAAPRPAVW
jgi:DNA-binding GntR family transcriptional regulator